MWPAADAGAVDRMGDLGVVWPRAPLAASEVLELEEVQAATTGELMSKDEVPARLWTLELPLGKAEPASVALEVAAYDGTPTAATLRHGRGAGRRRRLMAARRRARVASARARGAVGPRRTAAALWAVGQAALSRPSAAAAPYRGALWRLTATLTTEDRITMSSVLPGCWTGRSPVVAG
jgi:hypothetical protein